VRELFCEKADSKQTVSHTRITIFILHLYFK